MNGKPDERLDQWVRQSLDRLPDAPPPGSRFDAGQLWNQLQPELQKSAAHRARGWVWWAAAACLVGALLGWFLLNQQPEFSRRVVSRVTRQRVPMTIRTEPPITANVDGPKPQLPVKTGPSISPPARHSERIVRVSFAVLPKKEPTRPVVHLTEPPTIADTISTMTTSPEPPKNTAVAAAPTRRFRVVHRNELQAEEAIRPSPHRTDRFVRLGTGDKGQPVPETAHPTITWPSTNKLNQ